jgi:sugar lactone lactonase YvrE
MACSLQILCSIPDQREHKEASIVKQLGTALVIFGALLLLLATATALAAQSQPAVSVPIDLDPGSATGIRIEGLVTDSTGRLYTSDLDSRRLFRITPGTGQVEVLGTLPQSATGMAFDSSGNLYLASGANVLRIGASALTTGQVATSDVVTFATGVTGANGLAFGTTGKLYVSGAATGNIYIVASDGVTSTLVSGLKSERQDQQISTNGLAFGPDQKLYSSNTGTGAIDHITLKTDGTMESMERFVTDPLLLGADGITFASNGDLYVAANERNAIVRVTQDGKVSDVAANDNKGPLEFPASPAFSGTSLYASNFDIARGANAPNDPGVGASIAKIDVGVSGVQLPVVFATPVSATAPASTLVPTVQASPTGAIETPTAAIETPIAVTPTSEVEMPTPIQTEGIPGMPSTGGPGSQLLTLLVAIGAMSLLAGIALMRRVPR